MDRSLTGTAYTTRDGEGTVNGVWKAQGQVWMGVTVIRPGRSTVKTAILIEN